MNTTMNIIKTYMFYCTSALGATLAIKANVGVSSFNSMNMAISNAAELKIGTITILINLLFLLVYASLTKFKNKKTYMIQMITIFMFGILINLLNYGLLKNLYAGTYFEQLAFISIGTVISGLSIGMIVHYDIVTLPVEGTCLELAKLTKHSFSKFRYFIDVFSIVMSVIISIGFGLPLFVREGTFISMLLLTASMSLMQIIVRSKASE